MIKQPLSYKTAFFLALSIALIMHLFLVLTIFYGSTPPHAPVQKMTPAFDGFRVFISFLCTLITTFVLYLLNFAIAKQEKRGFVKIMQVIGFTFIATLILSALSSYLQIRLFDFGAFPERAFKAGFARDIFLAIVVVFSSQMLSLSYRKQLIAVENEALKAENAKTRYEVLKNQVNPHFLFNSLNTLNSIIKTDPDKAQDYVQELSSIFRYTLQNKEETTLQEEIEFTQSYCALMQIRYGKNLHFLFDIKSVYLNYIVIPLSIQTLVENAIKHNIIDSKQPLTITVSTSLDGDSVVVSNMYQPRKQPEESQGIGLANLSERYRLKWQKDITINNSKKVFSVIIPLMKPSEK